MRRTHQRTVVSKVWLERGVVPIGGVIGWLKNFTGTPALYEAFVECNGQTLTDPGTVYTSVPNLNASGGGSQRFLRGSTTSGTTGGADNYIPEGTMGGPSTTIGLCLGASQQPKIDHVHIFTGESASYLPSYYEVVWVVRIK